MPSPLATVHLIEPDPVTGLQLASFLRGAGLAVESLARGETLLERPPVRSPSCVVLSAAPHDAAALGLLRRLATERIQSPVVVTVPEADIATTVRAVRSGAFAVLPRPVGSEAVLAAVAQAIDRSREVLVEHAEQVEIRARHQLLSPREREVMACVVAGLLNKQVGRVLGITEHTVKAHRGAVMRKMGAASLAELVAMAIRLGLPITPHVGPWTRRPAGSDRVASLAS